MQLGPGEKKTGGHRRSSILADAFEAVAGAILLDSDVESCRDCLLRWFEGRLRGLADAPADKDAKTRLQEFLQGRRSPLPEYVLLNVSGDDHSQVFLVACRIKKPVLVVEGKGSSRRRAEQSAAEAAMAELST